MTRFHAADRIPFSSRTTTDEGFLVAPGTLARTGVQEYRAFELGMDGDPMRVVRLNRPADEVFEPSSLASFESKPVTLEHPNPPMVTADNWRELAVGEVRGVRRAGDLMAGTVLVKAADAIAAIESGKAELSNGYTFELDMTPGVTAAGDAYDGVQRNIRGNHVAIVDTARCGSACRVADSQLPKGKTMADAKRKVSVDGFSLEVDDTAANAIETLTKQRDEARAAPKSVKVGDTEHTLDSLAKLVGDQAAQIEALKKDVMTPAQRDAMVADWAKMVGEAKRLMPEVVTDGKTCLAIRREVITAVAAKDATAKAVADAVLAGRPVADADEPTVRAAFLAVAAAVKPAATSAADAAADAAQAAALLGGRQAAVDGGNDEPVGRDALMQRLAKIGA